MYRLRNYTYFFVNPTTITTPQPQDVLMAKIAEVIPTLPSRNKPKEEEQAQIITTATDKKKKKKK